jgi:hypothetical protein
MEMISNITLAGIGGLAGLLILSGVFLYDKNSIFAIILLIVGIILAVAIVGVELFVRYIDAQSRKTEAEAKAKWAPFTFSL